LAEFFLKKVSGQDNYLNLQHVTEVLKPLKDLPMEWLIIIAVILLVVLNKWGGC